MKLARLEIHRLSGLEPGFGVDFQTSGVNLVTGPNASGKSSLMRALRAVLYPESTEDYCELRALWQRNGRRIVCQRMGTQVDWFDDDGPIRAPALPDADNLGAFLISSEDLVGLGQTEQHISGELRKMLAGGLDLDAALDCGPLKARPRPQKLARSLADTTADLAAKEVEYAELSRQLDELEPLESELASMDEASNRLRACEDALALADAMAARKAVEQTLIDEYPGGMDRLHGDESERLDAIEQQLLDRRKEQSIEQNLLKRAREELKQHGRIDALAMEGLQAELAELRDRLLELERKIESQHDRVDQTLSARLAASRRLGSQDPEQLTVLDQAALEELEQRVDKVHELREQIRALTAELTHVHGSSSAIGRRSEDLRKARQALARWLESARLSPLEGILWGSLSLAVLIAAWRLMAAEQIIEHPELLVLIAVAAGIPLALLGQFIHRWRDRNRALNEFHDSDIEPPLGWTEGEVEARLERLDSELEAASRQEISQLRSAELRDHLNARRAVLDSARKRLEQWAAGLGIDARKRLETGFQLWCRHVHDWQQADQAWNEARQQLDQFHSRYQSLQKQAGERISANGFGSEQATTSHTLSALINRFSPLMRRAGELHQAIKSHEHRLSELEADISILEGNRARLFASAGVREGDNDTLRQRVHRLTEWQALERQRRDYGLTIERLEQRLAGNGDWLDLAQSQKCDQLIGQRDALAAQIARRDELNRTITQIRTRHDELLRRREVEALGVASERLRLSLHAELERQQLARAAALLIDDVRCTHQADHEPAALTRAAQWLARFTRHRYELRLRDACFAAWDSRDEQHRGVAELSTGTRFQLLLAVRLAWIEQAEMSVEPLPVFMDEVLTTTDPDRYRAVVETIQEIAADGRQLFYLTAQSDDAEAWVQWAGDGPKPQHIDLARVRRGQIEPLNERMPKRPAEPPVIPDPNTNEPLEWAEQVGVDPINPWAPTGRVHVFHLLQDRLPLAAELIRIDLDRVGELRTFLRSKRAGSLISDAHIELLEHRLAVLEPIVQDWCRRHDRPVDDQALHASGAITATFMPKIRALKEQLGGNPRTLIEALRNAAVARFRSDNIDQLEQWLLEHGYLNADPDRQRLSAAMISINTQLTPEQVEEIRSWIVAAIRDPLSSLQSSA